MTLVQFGSSARFERDDVLLMVRALTRLLDSSSRWPRATIEPIAESRAWLGRSVDCIAATVPEGCAPDGLRPEGPVHTGTGCGQRVDLEKERVLDLAADLLEAAARLRDAGMLVEAFALEGIEGRLLESLLGAGSVDAGS